MAAVRPKRNFGPAAVVGTILDIRDAIDDPVGGGVVGEIGRGVCDAVASSGFDGIPFNNRTGIGWVCEDYWADEGIDPPVDTVPFTGGQCPVNYQVRVQGNSSNGDAFGNFGGSYPGPVTDFRIVDSQPVASTPPGQVRYFWEFDYNGGTQADAGQTLSFSPINFSVRRQDGQPDNCGDPPPTSTPGPNNPGTPYGTPTPVPGRPDTVIIVEPPDTGPDGQPHWDVNIEIGGEPVGGPIEFSPTGEPSPPDSIGPFEEGPPVEPGDSSGDENTPESPNGGDCVGYKWELLDLPSGGSRIPGTSPVIFPSTVGNVQLRMSLPSGAQLFSDQVRILVESGTILRNSENFKVAGIRFNHLPDIGGIRLTPLYVPTEQDE